MRGIKVRDVNSRELIKMEKEKQTRKQNIGRTENIVQRIFHYFLFFL